MGEDTAATDRLITETRRRIGALQDETKARASASAQRQAVDNGDAAREAARAKAILDASAVDATAIRSYVENTNRLSDADKKRAAIADAQKARDRLVKDNPGASAAQVAQIESAYRNELTLIDKKFDKTKKLADAYAPLINAIREKTAAEEAGLGTTEKLSAGEAFALKIMVDLRDGTLKLTDAQKQALTVELQRYLAAEKTNIAEQEAAKAAKERTAALDRQVADEAKRIEALVKSNSALADEIAQIGLSAAALVEYRAEKARAAAAGEEAAAVALDNAAALLEEAGVLPEVAAGYRQLADARRAAAVKVEENGLLEAEKAAKQAAVKAAADADKAWEKFSDDIERSLTDSLYRAFDSGQSFGKAFAKNLQNTFKTMVLKFAVQAVVSSTGSVVAQTADAVLGTKFSSSGALNNVSSLGSALNLFSAGGASGASLLAANATGAVGGDALGALIAGNASSWGVSAAGVEGIAGTLGGIANASTAATTAATTAAGAAEGAATAAAGAASAMSWALPAIGAIAFVATNFKKIVGGQKSMGDGIQVVGSFDNSGFSGMQGQDWQKSGGWFGKKKNGMDWSMLSPEIDAAFDDLYKGVKAGLIDLGQRLGDDSVAGLLDGFTMSVDQRGVIQNVSGLATQIGNDLVKSMLSTVAPVVNDVMSRTGTQDWAGTLNTMTAQALGVDQALKLVGTSLEDTFGQQKLNDVLWVTDQFARMFGSVENMGNQLAAYVQNYYSEAEINSKAWSAMGDQFAALGETMPQTKAGFRDLVESLDLTSESGRQTFASLMTLAPAFAQLAGAAEAAQQKILADRQGWQDKLDVLTGATTERQLQLQQDLASTTDAATQALIKQVYAQEDMQAAASAAAAAAQAAAEAAAQAAAEAAAAIAQQRYGLETQLLQAQGNTTALRERELAALDESNRALQEQIWSLQDADAAAQAAAAEEQARQAAAQQAAQAAAAAAEAVANERYGLETQLLQVQGNTVELRVRELDKLNPANRALQEQIWALEDLATAAQKAAQVEQERAGLQKQLWQLQGNTAAIRAAELAALDGSNRALQEQIWALEDAKTAADKLSQTWSSITDSLLAQARKLRGEISGSQSYTALAAQFATTTGQARAGDATAAGQLVGLSDSLLSAYTDQATSRLDVQTMQAWLATSLEETAAIVTPVKSADQQAANEIKSLRADQQAQAEAMTRLLANMEKLYSRWDHEGLPATRAEV